MLSRLHGTALKLLAYELLLRNYPTWRKRLTLVQVCFPYSHSPDESSEVSREIREVVARIKAEFGDAAVHYWEVGAELAKGQWTVNDRLALFSISDVLLNTAMRDGLNLLPFEYVFTKSHLGSDGVCVLSEFVGCSHVLNAIIRVNPFNLEQIVEQARDPTSSPRHSQTAARHGARDGSLGAQGPPRPRRCLRGTEHHEHLAADRRAGHATRPEHL